MRGIGNINRAVHKKQTGPVQLIQGISVRVKDNLAVRTPVTGSTHCGSNHDRPRSLFIPRKKIQSMQSVKIVRPIGGFRFHIDGLRSGINDRCTGDAHLWLRIGTASRSRTIEGRFRTRAASTVRGVHHAGFPQRGATGVGVVGINAVVFRSDNHNVVDTAIDGDARHVEGLSVHLANSRHGEELAELIQVHIACIQNCLGRILSASRVVIVLGQNGGLSRGGKHNHKEKKGTCDVTVRNVIEIRVQVR